MSNSFILYVFFGIYLFIFGFVFLALGIYFSLYNFSVFLDWEFLSFNTLIVGFSLFFDSVSLFFMGCVLLISSMVVFYSFEYMSSDCFGDRFLFLVILFILSMMMLIVSPNLFSILLGWDGLGLVSYCLVVYFHNFKSYSAGMLTVLTNRIGDVAILIAISFIINSGGWCFVFSWGYLFNWWVLLMIILAAFTKSAQIPFSSWLPAAMAAPTPVSALVHSSTLVTAGVYLLVRFSFMFHLLDMGCLVFFSCLTMFMSGLGANFEFDLKSIIALSTLSQLGMMMFILSLGYPLVSFYHLLNHAFFKSLLFLCAGLIIHVIGDSQDVRFMGNIMSVLPITSSCFIIATLSLCGLPFLTGFYSKHLVFDLFVFNLHGFLVGLIFLLSLGLTVCYSFRLLFFCFSGFSGHSCCGSFLEVNFMYLPMIFLCFVSVFGGSIFGWFLFFDFSFSWSLMSGVNLIIFLLGFLIGWISSYAKFVFEGLSSLGFAFLGGMWFLPSLSTTVLYENSFKLVLDVESVMDMGWSESVLSGNLVLLLKYLSLFNSYYLMSNIKLIMMSFILFSMVILI
uniref:NADH-ubiquinone oxidoreductase chain 5 n=1 Tax=Aneurus sublobatus TaxID=1176473 RepID=A0A172DYU7_9HEMI|nr:NADH dehydrogenase subunit 5 [Aneurus sublobatus]AFI54694.1 NADH dehydrogenase subunit 5 [Aneurus sublobatus]